MHAGFRRQESCGERSALQTLLHSAALLHDKLPLVSVFVPSTETPEEKQFTVHRHTYIYHILLIRKMSKYSGTVLHCSCRGWLSVISVHIVWRFCPVCQVDDLWEAGAGNNTLLVLPRGQHVSQKHVRIVWQTSLTHDDGEGEWNRWGLCDKTPVSMKIGLKPANDQCTHVDWQPPVCVETNWIKAVEAPKLSLSAKIHKIRYSAFFGSVAFLEDFRPYFLHHSKMADRSTQGRKESMFILQQVMASRASTSSEKVQTVPLYAWSEREQWRRVVLASFDTSKLWRGTLNFGASKWVPVPLISASAVPMPSSLSNEPPRVFQTATPA